MTDVRSDRLSAGAGVLAAALFAAGFVLIGVDALRPMQSGARWSRPTRTTQPTLARRWECC